MTERTFRYSKINRSLENLSIYSSNIIFFLYLILSVLLSTRNIAITAIITMAEKDILGMWNNIKWQIFWQYSFKYLCVVIVFAATDAVVQFMRNITIEHIINRYRYSLLLSVLTFSLSGDNVKTDIKRGEVLSIAESDLELVRQLLSTSFVSPFMSLISGIIASFWIWSIDREACVLIYLICVAATLSSVRVIKRIGVLQGQIQEIQGDITDIFFETTTKSLLIRQLDIQAWRKCLFKDKSNALKKKKNKQADYETYLTLIQQATKIALTVGAVVLGAILSNKGRISTPDIAVLFNMSLLVNQMISSYNNTYNQFKKSVAGFKRVTETTKRYKKPADITTNVRRTIPVDTIKANEIGVLIGNCKVFEAVSFSCAKGNVVGIFGKSGAGKTTLVRTLLGFTTYSGNIYVNNEIVNQESLKKYKIGYCGQDVILFDGTIRYNLSLGLNEHVSDEEIWSALTFVELSDKVKLLPNKLNHILDEGAKTFSGGERRLLALARVMLMDPDVIILDESFAGVDAEKKQRILNRMNQVKRNKIVLIVSHDEAVLDYCDVMVEIR